MNSEGITLNVKVVPNASRTEIAGWLDGALKVRLQAPPEDGKANKALIKLLSKELGIPRKQIRIEAGEFSPLKRLAVMGVGKEDLERLT